MRVLLMDVNFGNSSTGNILLTLQEHLKARGHQVRVLYGRTTKQDFEGGTRVSSYLETLFHALLSRLTGYEGRYSHFATKKALREIADFRPDVIHFNDMHGYWINVLPLIKYTIDQNLPVLWTFHCEYPYTGKCGHAYDCQKWKSTCHQCPQVKSYPKSLFFDRSEEQFRAKKLIAAKQKNLHVACPSEWLSIRARKSFYRKHPIETIHNGVDLNVFNVQSQENQEKGGRQLLRIGFIGRDLHGGNKGGDIALKVAQELQGDATFIGIDSERNAAKKCSLNNVGFRGRLTQEGLAKFFNEIDVFLLTSRRETFSLMAAESLACGVPVIGIDSGAPAEIVTNTKYGKLVNINNVFSLPDAIRSQRDQGLLKGSIETQIERHKFIAENFSKSKMCVAYEKKFEELCQLSRSHNMASGSRKKRYIF